MNEQINEKIALKTMRAVVIIEKNKIDFFDELDKTNYNVEIDNNEYELYEVSNTDNVELLKKVQNLINDDDYIYDINYCDIYQTIDI